jgi:uncharacterized protein (TIGR02145 family)
MNMKTHLLFTTAITIAAAAVFTGCNKNDDNPDVPQVLTVAPENIDATIVAGTYTLAITSTQAWTAEVDAAATWCAISPNAAVGDATAIVNVIADNPVPLARVATITFTSGSLTATATVTQTDAAPILEVDNTEIPAVGHAADYVIAVTSNTTWTATVNTEAETWCTLADASTAGNGTVTVSIADNTTMEVRTATISISDGTLTRQVVVTQAFMPVFTDPRDGNRYSFVEMPDGKIWFAENLRYTKDLTWNAEAGKANGVPFVTTNNLTPYTTDMNGVPAIGSYWVPAQNNATVVPEQDRQSALDTYGAFYAWETIMMLDGKWSDEAKTSSTWSESWVSGDCYVYTAQDRTTVGSAPTAKVNNARGGRGICPEGWHVPTSYDWLAMIDAINGGTTNFLGRLGTGGVGIDEGAKLKSSGTYTGTYSDPDPGDGRWRYESGEVHFSALGIDTYGFRILSTGMRYCWDSPSFRSRGSSAGFWTSTANSNVNAWYISFAYNDYNISHYNGNRGTGFSVRCVKN